MNTQIRLISCFAITIASVVAAYADALPPAAPKAAETTDWAYIAGGCIFALAGALIFVWIGRRIFKR